MDMEISSFAFLISIFIFSIFIVLIKKKKSISYNHPPGPKTLPLIGNLHQLIDGQVHHLLAEMAKTYGPIMHIQLGQVPAVIISSAELAKIVLRTHEFHFLDRPFPMSANTIFYDHTNIILAPYGDYWREMKKIAILKLLSAKRVKSFRSIRKEQVSNFIEFIYSKNGSPVNLSRTVMSLMNSIIAIASIGKKLEKQKEEVIRTVTDAFMTAGGFSIPSDAFPSIELLLGKMSGARSEAQRIHQQADEFLGDIINEHKANMASKTHEADNILHVLLDIQEHSNLGFPLTTDNIKAIILETLGAGNDTTSATIEWAMSEMMKNPCVMRKAQEEVRRVFSEKVNVEEDDFHELKYLKLIIKETFRLHPPLTLFARESTEKCELCGYDIYPKTRVLINAWAIGRDPSSWEDPERFFPERFHTSSIDFKGNDFELLPFGSGKRMCPGSTMAMANVQMILAQLLYHFDWKLPDGAKSESIDMSECFGVITRKKLDLNLIPIPYPLVESK